MKKSQRFQAIVEIKATQEKKALETLTESRRRNQEEQRQLEHLIQYRQEYLDKFQVNAGAGMQVKALIDFRAFIEKLDQAIAGQTQMVRQTEQDVTHRHKQWEHLRQHTKSLQKVFDGMLAEELKMEDKREQAESDDRSSRMFRNLSNGMKNA